MTKITQNNIGSDQTFDFAWFRQDVMDKLHQLQQTYTDDQQQREVFQCKLDKLAKRHELLRLKPYFQQFKEATKKPVDSDSQLDAGQESPSFKGSSLNLKAKRVPPQSLHSSKKVVYG